MVDHAALVFGVVQTEGAAQIFGCLLRAAGVTALHMQRERGPEQHNKHHIHSHDNYSDTED